MTIKSSSNSSSLRLIEQEPVQQDQDREIESPAHYTEGRTIQPIEVLEDWDLNYHLASALKYIARAGRKHDEVKDLKKAVWFLERRIKLLEQQR